MTPAAYLARVREVRPADVAAPLATIERLRATLAAKPEDAALAAALGHLAQQRLLASNTLRRPSADERRAWDAANVWLHERLARGEARLRSADLAALNALLGGGGPRTGAVYTGADAYLAATEVDRELAALDAYLDAQHDAHQRLVASAVAYVSVVTIHPFANANGRTARLAADALLLADGYLPLTFRSSIATHVAQTEGGPAREPVRAVARTLDAIAGSYASVLSRIP